MCSESLFTTLYIGINHKIFFGQNKHYKKALFFLLRPPFHHSITFNLQFLYKLKHLVHLSKAFYGMFHFLFRLASIKLYIFLQQKNWLFDFKTSGICISRPPALCLAPGAGSGPQFVFTGPGPRFVFTGPGQQFVFTGPGPKFVFSSPGHKFVFTGPGLLFIIYQFSSRFYYNYRSYLYYYYHYHHHLYYYYCY